MRYVYLLYNFPYSLDRASMIVVGRITFEICYVLSANQGFTNFIWKFKRRGGGREIQ
jgi:hypothetical protein